MHWAVLAEVLSEVIFVLKIYIVTALPITPVTAGGSE